MKFSCNILSFKKAIQIVEKSVQSKSSLPVLENIYFELKNGELTCRGNDMEIGIETRIEIQNQEGEGCFLIKARTISNIFSKLNMEIVHIEIFQDYKVIIKAENIVYELLGHSPDEYPEFPEIELNQNFMINAQQLKEMIRYTLFSVSSEETKQFLNGILLKNESDSLIFVSTDGYRLSLKKHHSPSQSLTYQVILPQKTMTELYKILQQQESNSDIGIVFQDSQVVFYKKDFKLVSRVIQGKFPDYNQVIPSEIQYSYQISRRSLLDAFERSSIVASESSDIIRLYFSNQDIQITANAIGMGDFKESVSMTKTMESPDVKVAFNVKLFIEGLKVIESDDLLLSFHSEVSPCKIQPVGDDQYIYIIMPIRTSDFNHQTHKSQEAVVSST